MPTADKTSDLSYLRTGRRNWWAAAPPTPSHRFIACIPLYYVLPSLIAILMNTSNIPHTSGDSALIATNWSYRFISAGAGALADAGPLPSDLISAL